MTVVITQNLIYRKRLQVRIKMDRFTMCPDAEMLVQGKSYSYKQNKSKQNKNQIKI